MSKYTKVTARGVSTSYALFLNKDHTLHHAKNKEGDWISFFDHDSVKIGHKNGDHKSYINTLFGDRKSILKCLVEYGHDSYSKLYRSMDRQIKSLIGTKEKVWFAFDFAGTAQRLFIIDLSYERRYNQKTKTKIDFIIDGDVYLIDSDGPKVRVHSYEIEDYYTNMKTQKADKIDLAFIERKENAGNRKPRKIAEIIPVETIEQAKADSTPAQAELFGALIEASDEQASIIEQQENMIVDQQMIISEQQRLIAELTRKTNRFESSMSDAEIEDDLAGLLE